MESSSWLLKVIPAVFHLGTVLMNSWMFQEAAKTSSLTEVLTLVLIYKTLEFFNSFSFFDCFFVILNKNEDSDLLVKWSIRLVSFQSLPYLKGQMQ